MKCPNCKSDSLTVHGSVSIPIIGKFDNEDNEDNEDKLVVEEDEDNLGGVQMLIFCDECCEEIPQDIITGWDWKEANGGVFMQTAFTQGIEEKYSSKEIQRLFNEFWKLHKQKPNEQTFTLDGGKVWASIDHYPEEEGGKTVTLLLPSEC